MSERLRKRTSSGASPLCILGDSFQRKYLKGARYVVGTREMRSGVVGLRPTGSGPFARSLATELIRRKLGS